MERRDFFKSACALCGLALIPGALVESCTKQSYTGPSNVNFTLDLTQSANAALNTVGGAVIANGVIVIRSSAGTFNALSATCTHQGCQVGYNSSAQEIVCPCHGGTYNLSGKVLGGPPPSALTTYTATLSGNILTVKS
ncbi:MAG: ubiquinol-cytochrome c reductase iron-sulfur subunit [Flavipsychrobacter sp.]